MKIKGLLLIIFFLCLITQTAYAELETNMSADVVLGQPDFTSTTTNQGGASASSLGAGVDNSIFSNGHKMYICDASNYRVLIWNSIPTTNKTPADVVIGQADFTSVAKRSYAVFGTRMLNLPAYAFSDGKKFFLVDEYNSRILIYNSIPATNDPSPDVVVGDITPLAPPAANKLKYPFMAWSDGKKLFVADTYNHRVLIYNSIPTANYPSADIVIGQTNFTSGSANQGGSTGANTLNYPTGVFSDGKKLFITDFSNHRVLIYNSIPTTNNASADVVIGQSNFTSNAINQTGSTTVAGANTLYYPFSVYSDGKRLFIAEEGNNRVLVYNSIPTANNASADIVIGQPNFTSNAINQTGSATVAGANTLYCPAYVCSDGKRLFVRDGGNHRALIYNIGSSIPLGPQFEQGKAVLGKVFNDLNGNGKQDENELGVEGVKVCSDTGIYAITDSDGKYHFPYIETGQHLLKLDTITLPQGTIFTTPTPYKVTVTKGILTKVSFGVKLPEPNEPNELNKPLLKVSITQDPVLLKPKLAVSTAQDTNNIIFNITCNYYLFVKYSTLTIYDQDYELVKFIKLPQPIPSKHTLPVSELPTHNSQPATYYYQLCVYDKEGKEDRTGIGSFNITQ